MRLRRLAQEIFTKLTEVLAPRKLRRCDLEVRTGKRLLMRERREIQTFRVAWLWRSTGLGGCFFQGRGVQHRSKGKCCCNFHHQLPTYYTRLGHSDVITSVYFPSLSTFEGKRGIIYCMVLQCTSHSSNINILKQCASRRFSFLNSWFDIGIPC